MSQEIRAIYENGLFRPLDPVSVTEHDIVSLVIGPVASAVEIANSTSEVSTADAAAARAEFERCIGSLDLGRPIGIANPAIDADIARQYGAT